MSEKVLDQCICLKEYISENDYKEINQLKDICSANDKTNLKLELNYKLSMSKHPETGLKNINEFLYYVDGVLVAYLGISSFGGNTDEINGITHPDFRRKGIFTKLLKIAIEQCQKRNPRKLLLLTDDKSNSGVEFIKAFGGKYDFSEYRMKLSKNIYFEESKVITLRKAQKSDGREINKQNVIYFNDEEEDENESYEKEQENENEITYMVEHKGDIIGKIRVDYSENSAFLCGFGILPDFRGKGYGKATLMEVLRLVNEKNIHEVGLDVESKNSTALNLYKSCGFEEKSVMNYYMYK